MFSQGKRQKPGPQPGSDLEYQISVDFWTSIRGGNVRLQITRQEVCPTCKGKGTTGAPVTCPECHGTGQIHQVGGRMKFNTQCPRCGGTGKIETACPACHGEGTISRADTVEIRLKPGTRDGQRIRLAGRGNAGVNGGPPGDLYLIVKVEPHPVFSRVADDIQVTVPVTVTEAALGAKIEVPTIDGRAQLKIPPGTQSGQKLRMREKGVPSATREGQRGDEIVTVEILVPAVQDERSKEILREFAKLNPQDPREPLFHKV
jgi:molecular chaperone DnaJ